MSTHLNNFLQNYLLAKRKQILHEFKGSTKVQLLLYFLVIEAIPLKFVLSV